MDHGEGPSRKKLKTDEVVSQPAETEPSDIASCFTTDLNTETHKSLGEISTTGPSMKVNSSLDDFRLIRYSDAFVDKTLLINSIIEEKETKLLLSAPRKFGKTTNITMVKYFFEALPDEQQVSKNRELFKDTLIEQKHGDLFESHFAKFPVIHLDFKSSCDTYDSTLHFIRKLIRREYIRHQYLEKADDARTRTVVSKWCDPDAYSLVECTPESLKEAATDLAKYLRDFHKHPVLIIVDEYDSLTNDMICFATDTYAPGTAQVTCSAQNEIDKVALFCSGLFLDLLKGNDDVGMGILTGISYITTMGLSKLNNVVAYKFHEENPHNNFYGLTLPELKDLLQKFGRMNEFAAVKSHYNGYQNDIVNTYSIIRYLNEKKIRNFWKQSGIVIQLSSALKIDSIRDIICKLLGDIDNTMKILYFNKIETIHLTTLMHILKGKDPEAANVEIFLNFIMEQGYLRAIKFEENNEEDITNCTVSIPNLEIRKELREQLYLYFVSEYNINLRLVRKCAALFDRLNRRWKNNLKSLVKIKGELDDIFNSLKVAVKNEATMHHIVFFILLFSVKFRCFSEAKSSRTRQHRLDILLQSNDLSIILELKFKHNAKEALQQIISKNYCQAFKSKSYNPDKVPVNYFILIGLNYSEKNNQRVIDFEALINTKKLAEKITVV